MLDELLGQWSKNEESYLNDEALAIRILEEAGRHFISKDTEPVARSTWFRFLDTTRSSLFLSSLSAHDHQNQWAELVFKVLQHTNYTLLDMMEQRVVAHPDRVLFRDLGSFAETGWTYAQILRHTREIAALFYQESKEPPRVALFSENCLEGACADLACLMFDIYNTPLSPHLKSDQLIPIFDQLKITIAVADSQERLTLLNNLLQKVTHPFLIFSLQSADEKKSEYSLLAEACKHLTLMDIDRLLENRKRKKTSEVATTMFTSGSTGIPKGVSFSIYNIISKRFARAAALPAVDQVTFLSYLPLYHTFGRYLEMTGAIFWSGTYTFAGNTSAETLFTFFPKVNPSGFISIPLRWQELYERCQEKIENIDNQELREKAVREITGSRLSWGLSAAGFLDPQVFRFFNQYGIRLNSGFGMTEATGGITMTPPGMYRDFKVGFPLPGVYLRLGDSSELEISGHYIARYLEDAGPGDQIPYPDMNNPYWMKTGDVFQVDPEGYYEIVDRVKDIYKNNRGQTVAPQTIERKFHHVPGIKSVFLVGDNRPYNVLLISPDLTDPMFQDLGQENLNEYYHQIVMAANADVAPYERVINFTLLNRDFDASLGELTPKGSFNRKQVENNFAPVIETLYQSKVNTIQTDNFTITIPKWLYRDLGILETDLVYRNGKLINISNGRPLVIRRVRTGTFIIGHLIYRIDGQNIDLGILTRQPGLWLGNPSFAEFCPVKEGWDVNLHQFSPATRVYRFGKKAVRNKILVKSIRNHEVQKAHELFHRVMCENSDHSYAALEELGKFLTGAEPRLSIAIRHRIESLACHPEEEIRCLAYRLLLLNSTQTEGMHSMLSFIESGLSFLNESSIRQIASSNFGKHRLDALKLRLHWYRTHLKWPASKKQQKAFADVLGLLYNFAQLHLEFYAPVRAELTRWILHRQDPQLSKMAEKYFLDLAVYFEKQIEQRNKRMSLKSWKSKLVFENGIPDNEKERIISIFSKSGFLDESIILTFNEWQFSTTDVTDNGIWVMRLLSFKDFRHYRVSINTAGGKHFDLHLVMSGNIHFKPRPETFYWMAYMASFPKEPALTPVLGSSRPGIGAMTTQYVGGLSAWDKIRELSEIHLGLGQVGENAWRKIFIKSFAVVFKALKYSGMQIVPGAISPTNIVVPELDFRDSAVILSLAGWTPYINPMSVVKPAIQDFYCRTASVYPWCRKQLRISWLFDACLESLGNEDGITFLKEMRVLLRMEPVNCFDGESLVSHLDLYLEELQNGKYLPLAVYSAIDHYLDWLKMNPLTTIAAKEQMIMELLELYRLNSKAEYIRYYIYRNTLFYDAAEELIASFDKLLLKLKPDNSGMAIQQVELSDLQSLIVDAEVKPVFMRMIFPRLQGTPTVDLVKMGERFHENLLVKFIFRDRSCSEYTLRRPLEPRETGQLYQLFYREKYPKEISDYDHQLVATDNHGRIIGGITYRYLENSHILLDGIVVTTSLQGRGIAAAMLESFFAAMSAHGIIAVRAHFLFGNYYMKHFFEVDKNWGALIKRLN